MSYSPESVRNTSVSDQPTAHDDLGFKPYVTAIAEFVGLTELTESEELTNPTEKEQVSLWGLLVFHQCHQTRQWQADEIELVKQLATQTAIAIQQAELYRQLQLSNQELERLSITDTLTQITNRRGFDDYFQREWRRSARNQTSLALILCDIDYFKQYNDTYGHPLGDDCLFQVAQLLKNQLKRPGDCVARYGGEEFILILPDTDRNGAIQLVESIRLELQQLNYLHQSSLVATYITLSFGIAVTVPSHQTNLELLINQADQSLFEAKHQGRNGYVFYES